MTVIIVTKRFFLNICWIHILYIYILFEKTFNVNFGLDKSPILNITESWRPDKPDAFLNVGSQPSRYN